MLFTKHSGVVVDFSDVELAQGLSRLEAGNTRFCAARDDVVFVNTGGGLLLVDASWHIARRLLEMYVVATNSTFPFQISFVLNSTSFSLSQALLGAGHVTPTVTALEQDATLSVDLVLRNDVLEPISVEFWAVPEP